MDLQDYALVIGDALHRHETLVFAGRCTIRYSGRAESFLPEGDRLFLIKKDKTLLIHQPQGNTPINYMKSGATHTFTMVDGVLKLKASNPALKETIEADISKVYFFNSSKLQDAEVISVAGTEEDMSDMLYENPNLIEKGFVPAAREEQTKYGFIDVFGTDKNGVVTVVECKRYCADLAAVTQLRRYVEKIMISKGITKVRGIIAAPKITDNAKTMLNDWGFDFVAVRPPKYLEEYTKKQARLDGF
ncbi:MAG: endonuclease NucS [Nanoarchaeota archaeon]